jgi:hypothetical protein
MVHVLTSGDVAVGALADLAEAATRLGRGPDAAAAGGSRRQADDEEDEDEEEDEEEEEGEESAQVNMRARPCKKTIHMPLRLPRHVSHHPVLAGGPLRCCCSTPAWSCCPSPATTPCAGCVTRQNPI